MQDLTQDVNLYTDSRHPNSDGNKLISSKMEEYLKFQIKKDKNVYKR